MKTAGEFLTDCGRSLAPFERLRVGRVGCFVALAAIAGSLVALATGLHDTGGSWAAGFRFCVLCALGAAIAVFLGYALVETLTERAVWRRVEIYMRESGTDLETLFRAAEMRQSQVPGGHRVVALLNEKREKREEREKREKHQAPR
ncbi:MAG TPA: hypothetical protein VFE84_10535 [Patescibacteria group bacterium]|nr:hypothetical protein [Patescibacteria group bacterium]